MNYYPHNIGDYAAATRRLSLMEHGAYRCLMDLYYLDEKPLPANPEALCRLLAAQSEEEKAAVRSVAREYFRKAGGVLRHKRCDKEIAQYRVLIERSRVNGRKGGRPPKCGGGNASGQSRAQMQASVQAAGGAAPAGEGAAVPVPLEGVHLPVDPSVPVPTPPGGPSPEPLRPLTYLPAGFGVSAAVRGWAMDRGYDRLERRCEHFISYAKRRAAQYADWDEALMTAIREDWARLDAPTQRGGGAVAKVSYLGDEEVM